MTAKDIINKLQLTPLPEEGGFYRQTYKAEGLIPQSALPQHGGDRAYTTAIYYLITPEEFSGLHLVKSDELFHFYAGDPVQMVQINTQGALKKITLGSDLHQDQQPQVLAPKDVWQGTKLIAAGKWALLGCTVSPGFEFEDFTCANTEELCAKFPQHSALIKAYTHA